MLARSLTSDEVDLLRHAELFIRRNHHDEGGHDASHVLAVTDYAIGIAQNCVEPADPFVVVMGALLHDLGRIGADTGVMHGLTGAALAREYLDATSVPEDVRERILRVVARHTPTTGIPPKSTEERIVFDADALDRLGIMGMLRGLMGKRGSTEDIVESRIQKRLGDYDRLHFDVSRRMGEALHKDTIEVVGYFREALREEARQLHRVLWPVEAGVEVPIPSLGQAAAKEGTPDLTQAMARVEPSSEREEPPPGSGSEEAEREELGSWPRLLTDREIALVEQVAGFVETQHAAQKAHDYAHVLTVVKNALRIARHADGQVDPFILILGAFFHDLGWVGNEDGGQHGLRGASAANEYLASTWLSAEQRLRVRRIVIRHSMTSDQRPETAEERIVWDADGLAGLGLVGVLRGIITGAGSSEEIIEACFRYTGKRAEGLYMPESLRIAETMLEESDPVVDRFVEALEERRERVHELRLPVV